MPGNVRSTLGAPLEIRGTVLPNRIVSAPMERNYCTLDGRVTRRYVDYLRARAAGGAGLTFTESSYVTQASKARPAQMGLHRDHVIEPLAALADAVHAEGGLLGVELNHAGRVVPSSVSQLQPVAPSAVPCAEIGGEMPRAMTIGDIDDAVEAFALAARRAVDAGVDVISIHGAHGYLIAQFLSPRSNRRTDEYGEPAAFLNRVVHAVRDSVGERIPIFLRLSAFEGLPGGLDDEATIAAVARADLDQIDVIDVSAGTYGAGEWITPSGEVEEGYLAERAARYRRFGRVVCVAGRITTADAAARIVAGGAADLVAVGRALHADPEWARHAMRGSRPRPCISCNQGCADVIHRGVPLWCAVNPATGREGRSRRRGPLRADLLVVGGGLAGMEAAVTAAEAGLRVRLVERAAELGGQFALAARLRPKPQFPRLLTWYRDRLASLGVDVCLRTDQSVDEIGRSSDGIEAVIVATGGAGYVPPVPGSDRARVVEVREWLRTGAPAPGDEVIVWGGDRAAVYVADDLLAHGHRVTVVTSAPELAPEAGARERLPAVRRLTTDPGVTVHLGVSVERIDENAVICGRGDERFTVDSAALIIASHGVMPANSALGPIALPAGRVAWAGDAAGGTTIDEAIATGRSAALEVIATIEDGSDAGDPATNVRAKEEVSAR